MSQKTVGTAESLSIRGKPTAAMPLRQLQVMAKAGSTEIRGIAKAELARRGTEAPRTNYAALSDATLSNIVKRDIKSMMVGAQTEIERRHVPSSAPATEVTAQSPDMAASAQASAENAPPIALPPVMSGAVEGDSGGSEREPHEDAQA